MGLGSGINNNSMGLGTGLAGLDVNQGNANYGANASIGNANANADLSGLNASANMWGGIMGGASMLSSFLSDARAKDDIEQVGELYDGQPVHRYRYKGDGRHQIGLIAQEVERDHPDAIVESGGLKHVDYRRATDRAAGLSRFLKQAA